MTTVQSIEDFIAEAAIFIALMAVGINLYERIMDNLAERVAKKMKESE